MKTNISLSVPQPCSEKWENFIPAASGGHCAACNHVVVDFTKMTDDEVIRYFKTQHGSTCGRFKPEQLKIYKRNDIMNIKPGFPLLKIGLAGLMMLFLSREVYASRTMGEVNVEVVDQAGTNLNAAKSEKHLVRGVVKSEYGEVMAGVYVTLAGTTIGTTTDADGKFEFPQRLKAGDVLEFNFIGMETMTYVVPTDAVGDVEIAMSCTAMIMGKMMIVEEETPERGFFGKVWDQVKRVF